MYDCDVFDYDCKTEYEDKTIDVEHCDDGVSAVTELELDAEGQTMYDCDVFDYDCKTEYEDKTIDVEHCDDGVSAVTELELDVEGTRNNGVSAVTENELDAEGTETTSIPTTTLMIVSENQTLFIGRDYYARENKRHEKKPRPTRRLYECDKLSFLLLRAIQVRQLDFLPEMNGQVYK